MAFEDLVLYVMSGTGNTYRVAQWMKEIADERGVPAQVLMIDDVTRENRPESKKGRLFGVMFPAHGLMMPWSMLKYVLKMPMGKGASIISVSTRGAIKLGPVIIPGAVGLGNFMAALILLFKGYRVKGWFSLDMPVNMISLHWGMKPQNAEIVLRRARKKIEPVILRALDQKYTIFFRNTVWDFLWGAIPLWFIPVFPILYYLYGKTFMGKLLYPDNRCIGCGLCAKFCPNEAIVMKTVFGKKRPFWTYHCEACLRCMGFCRQKAVETGHSWGVLLYYLTLVPLITYFLKKLDVINHLFSGTTGYWSFYLLQAIDIIPALLISYWLFWLLIRIPAVNTVFTYTTLTRYFRRYHEPGTRLKDLKKGKKRL